MDRGQTQASVMDANATAVALADHASAINRGWVMAMAFNVLMMQSGFAMLEVSAFVVEIVQAESLRRCELTLPGLAALRAPDLVPHDASLGNLTSSI